MTVKQIIARFLEAFKIGSPAEQITLIIETMRQLCLVYGSEIEARTVPEPEKVVARMAEHGVSEAIEFAFVAADPLDGGAMKMIRTLLLFGPTRAVTIRPTVRYRETIAQAGLQAGGDDVGSAISAFLRETCDANIQVPAEMLAEIASFRDSAIDLLTT